MKKRKLTAGSSEAPTVGIAELQDAITNLRIEFDIQMTGHEKQSSCHTTMLQEIKGMLIWMHSNDNCQDQEE